MDALLLVHSLFFVIRKILLCMSFNHNPLSNLLWKCCKAFKQIVFIKFRKLVSLKHYSIQYTYQWIPCFYLIQTNHWVLQSLYIPGPLPCKQQQISILVQTILGFIIPLSFLTIQRNPLAEIIMFYTDSLEPGVLMLVIGCLLLTT